MSSTGRVSLFKELHSTVQTETNIREKLFAKSETTLEFLTKRVQDVQERSLKQNTMSQENNSKEMEAILSKMREMNEYAKDQRDSCFAYEIRMRLYTPDEQLVLSSIVDATKELLKESAKRVDAMLERMKVNLDICSPDLSNSIERSMSVELMSFPASRHIGSSSSSFSSTASSYFTFEIASSSSPIDPSEKKRRKRKTLQDVQVVDRTNEHRGDPVPLQPIQPPVPVPIPGGGLQPSRPMCGERFQFFCYRRN